MKQTGWQFFSLLLGQLASFSCLWYVDSLIMCVDDLFFVQFDAFEHPTIHWSMTLVFIVCVALSAVFQTGEVVSSTLIRSEVMLTEASSVVVTQRPSRQKILAPQFDIQDDLCDHCHHLCYRLRCMLRNCEAFRDLSSCDSNLTSVRW